MRNACNRWFSRHPHLDVREAFHSITPPPDHLTPVSVCPRFRFTSTCLCDCTRLCLFKTSISAICQPDSGRVLHQVMTFLQPYRVSSFKAYIVCSLQDQPHTGTQNRHKRTASPACTTLTPFGTTRPRVITTRLLHPPNSEHTPISLLCNTSCVLPIGVRFYLSPPYRSTYPSIHSQTTDLTAYTRARPGRRGTPHTEDLV